MVVCLRGARISLDLCESFKDASFYLDCGKVINRVHLNPVFKGKNMPQQAQKINELTFESSETLSVRGLKK